MDLTVGAIVEGKVTGITKFGAFVALPENKSGMVHISEVASSFVNDIKDFLQEGQTVKVLVLSTDNGKINLSIKKALPQQERPVPRGPRPVQQRPAGGAPRPAPRQPLLSLRAKSAAVRPRYRAPDTRLASAVKAAIRVVPRGMFFPAPVFRGRGVFVFGG